MRTAALLVLIGFAATASAEAQGRGRNARGQGIPPGQMPPAGLCRVWYDGVPPGRQPRPTSCNEAERIASRDQYARVIYGDDRTRGTARNGAILRDRSVGGGVPYPYPNRNPNQYPNRYPNVRGGVAYNNAAYQNGYRDGLEKGREDAGDRDSYDPVRHSRYRSADHGYNSRYGTKDDYKLVYRDGFEAGYDEGYRTTRR
jgi:hypothetical protein